MTDWTLELPWALVATAAVVLCVSLVLDAYRDRAVARKHDFDGPARELAESAIVQHCLRLAVAVLVSISAWVSLLFIPAMSYTYTGQYVRNYIWFAITITIVFQGLAERRTRVRVLEQVRRERRQLEALHSDLTPP